MIQRAILRLKTGAGELGTAESHKLPMGRRLVWRTLAMRCLDRSPWREEPRAQVALQHPGRVVAPPPRKGDTLIRDRPAGLTRASQATEVMSLNAASERAIGDARELLERLAEAYDRTAAALERSAALAETHAERQQRAGRSKAAEDEHRTAEWAREAAQRAHRAASRAREAAQRARSLAGG